ncbi:MAG: DUF1015 domain-containing protein [Lentisphaerae bacterium]|nr:DUF1015 domain-containing protein [Lentisphaerota bacterium]
MKVKAFRGIRPAAEMASQVASVPYDTVNTEEARALAAGNPVSFLHVVRAEIDLAAGTDPYAPEVYAQSARALSALREGGILIQDETPQLYIYAITMGDHTQVGVVACCAVSDYEDGTIKRHEQTREDKLRDRVTLVNTLSANSGPVFLTYKDEAGVSALVSVALKADPIIDFVTPTGNRHALWVVPDSAALEAAFGQVPAGYIADGHHRAAAAAEVAKLRRAGTGAATATDAGSDWFLCVLFPASQMNVMSYNRVIHDLNGQSPAGFLEAIGQLGTLTPGEAKVPAARGSVGIYLEGQWHLLTWDAVDRSDVVGRLDVSVLQDRVLEPLLGISDPRRDTRVDFVGGIRGISELERLVDSGRGAVAFAMHPVEVADLIAISDAGRLMPPKSTWFEPKLLSGLLVHAF